MLAGNQSKQQICIRAIHQIMVVKQHNKWATAQIMPTFVYVRCERNRCSQCETMRFANEPPVREPKSKSEPNTLVHRSEFMASNVKFIRYWKTFDI